LQAGTNVSKSGNILITVRDKDKQEMLEIAQKFYLKGFGIYATSGTAKFLENNGIHVTKVEKLWEGQNSIIDLIENGKINFVINTPTKGKEANRDGFKIRRMAAECKIPCFTSLDTVNALYAAIEDENSEEKLDIIDIAKI
jgi:carbamoyl-phosphate synthase large subunit